MEEKRSWWQYIPKYWVAMIIIVLVGVSVLIVLGYLFKWNWTGFNSGTNEITVTNDAKDSHVIYTVNMPLPQKALWDWLGLLAVLAIPVVVGLGAAGYAAQQAKVSDRENTDNQRETALQTYIDKMSELILKDGLLDSKAPEIGTIAEVQTLTVLRRLDAERKGMVLQYLYQASLIDKVQPKIKLSRANLQGAYLGNFPLKDLRYGSIKDLNNAILARSAADITASMVSLLPIPGVSGNVAELAREWMFGLFKAFSSRNGKDILTSDILSNVFNTNMSSVNLSQTDLTGAILTQVNLSETNLSQALLRGTYLIYANLHAVDLSGAILSDADLSNADLSNAILFKADLSKTKLEGAKLNKAWVTKEQLDKAKSLKGAIMPDGKMYHNSSGVNLRASNLSGVDLSGVDLSGADLSGADLSYSNLTGADLSRANLEEADLKEAIGITLEELEKNAKSLKGATMPDGSIHP